MASLNISPCQLPLSEIPGSYGLPLIGPIKDRWDFFYLQGHHHFFKSRMEKYNSTVFRANLPPGPLISPDSRAVILLDANSFPILFDNSKVDKRDCFAGTYLPSTSFVGSYRACPYLDPSEPTHGSLKALFLSILASKNEEIIPIFQTCLQGLFPELENELRDTGRADFGPPNDALSLEFAFRLFCDGKSLLDTILEANGPSIIRKWIYLQVAPMVTLGLPKYLNPVEDLILHSFRMPFHLVKNDYKKLYDAFSSSAISYLNKAESYGLSREEACHNLAFVVGFNSFGFSKWFPSLVHLVASAGESLHRELAEEIRAIVKSKGGVTLDAIKNMKLTQSVVYEALRIDPPTPFQFGRAKDDLMVQSHDASFKIKKGEMIMGYQPLVMQDSKVFYDPETFIGGRFVGEGEKLLKYVYWSNGSGIDEPTVENKQCPGKSLVELISCVLIAEMFLRYDTFSVEVGSLLPNPKVSFVSLKKIASA